MHNHFFRFSLRIFHSRTLEDENIGVYDVIRIDFGNLCSFRC